VPIHLLFRSKKENIKSPVVAFQHNIFIVNVNSYSPGASHSGRPEIDITSKPSLLTYQSKHSLQVYSPFTFQTSLIYKSLDCSEGVLYGSTGFQVIVYTPSSKTSTLTDLPEKS